MVYDEVALEDTKAVELASSVPVQVFVVVANPALPQTISLTVSAPPEASVSDDVLKNVTATPGIAGELSLNALNVGL